MAFAFSDHHIEEYRTQGYTVFRQILPLSLVADLRRVCDAARDLARRASRRACPPSRPPRSRAPPRAGSGSAERSG